MDTLNTEQLVEFAKAIKAWAKARATEYCNADPGEEPIEDLTCTRIQPGEDEMIFDFDDGNGLTPTVRVAFAGGVLRFQVES